MTDIVRCYIDRFYTPHGTFGELSIPGGFWCKTVEPPWKGRPGHPSGLPGRSCVPQGVYQGVWYDSPRYGATWALKNLDFGVAPEAGKDVRRSHIIIHAANTPSELKGCIGLGDKFGIVGYEWAVLNSRATIATFLNETRLYTEQEVTLLFILRHQNSKGRSLG